MMVEQIAGLTLALVMMGVGLIGSVLPGVPGTPLILVAAVLHRLYFGADSVGNLVLGMLVGLTLVAMLLDYVASLVGARRLGATWRGVLGAMLGGVFGLTIGPLGVLIGPFVGATALELISGREFREAARAGLGAFLGLLAGAVGKVACSAAMIGLFAFSVLARHLT